MDYLIRKKVMPTDMTSAELAQLSADVRNSSLFSARNTIESVLDDLFGDLPKLVNPTVTQRPDRMTAENPEGNVTVGLNPAQVRERLAASLRRAGYEPDPDERGTIKDLGSAQRIELVEETNRKLAEGYGAWRQGQATLDSYPALELYRQEDRDDKRAWSTRFRLAGDNSGRAFGDGWIIMPDGGMFALKNHPIWEMLGSNALFDDALGNPWPPFAFTSGMWVRPVARRVAVELGIYTPGTRIPPVRKTFELGEA